VCQVIDRWIYTGRLCFGLDVDERARSGFGYGYPIYQVESSRNLLFASGAMMDPYSTPSQTDLFSKSTSGC